VQVRTVTPAGRARYVAILHQYLLRNRHIIDKHIWWRNTDHEPDVRYLRQLVDEFPDFYEIQEQKEPWYKDTFNIHRFYPDCACDPDTVYIRFDDDICWMADDAIEKLVACRLAHPKPFLVFGNIVNNAICNCIHQQIGAIPADLPLTWKATCPFSWENGWAGFLFHEFFFKHCMDKTLDRYKFGIPNTLISYERFSISVASWLGKDFAKFGGEVGGDEEWWLSEVKPAELKRPCMICGDALFVHFAFHTQRPYLEQRSTCLAAYEVLARSHDIQEIPSLLCE
jgi:hypothetical protein